MAPRICTTCDEPHVTTDWYQVFVHKKPVAGLVECSSAHEDRIRRETREMACALPRGNGPNEEAT